MSDVIRQVFQLGILYGRVYAKNDPGWEERMAALLDRYVSNF